MKYKTAYFCGYAKLPSSLPTTIDNSGLTLGMEIDLERGLILAVSITLLSALAKRMLDEYFVGKNVAEDYDQIVEEISYRHQGLAAKPIIKAFSDIRRNYLEYMKANGPFLRGEQ